MRIKCARGDWGSSIVGVVCPDCEHNSTMHPGIPNPSLVYCLACEFIELKKEVIKDATGK